MKTRATTIGAAFHGSMRPQPARSARAPAVGPWRGGRRFPGRRDWRGRRRRGGRRRVAQHERGQASRLLISAGQASARALSTLALRCGLALHGGGAVPRRCGRSFGFSVVRGGTGAGAACWGAGAYSCCTGVCSTILFTVTGRTTLVTRTTLIGLAVAASARTGACLWSPATSSTTGIARATPATALSRPMRRRCDPESSREPALPTRCDDALGACGLPKRALERDQREQQQLEADRPGHAADEPRRDGVDLVEQDRPPEQDDARGQTAGDGF